MLGKIMGAVIGSSIDRQDGEGGLKGAIMGAVATTILRRLGPVGWVIGGLWALWKLLFGSRRRKARY